MKSKSEVKVYMTNFYNLVQTQFDASFKCVRTDNGVEFIMRDFYNDLGIIHQTSSIYTPQQNGVVERKHQHLLQVARALLFQSNVPLTHWTHCVLTTAHIINRLPTEVLSNKTPFEMLYNKPATYDHFRSFGCLCYCSTLKELRNKFDRRAYQCVFVGYPLGIKG